MSYIPPVHAGIEIVAETTEEEALAAEGKKPELTEGVTVAYTKPVTQVSCYTVISVTQVS